MTNLPYKHGDLVIDDVNNVYIITGVDDSPSTDMPYELTPLYVERVDRLRYGLAESFWVLSDDPDYTSASNLLPYPTFSECQSVRYQSDVGSYVNGWADACFEELRTGVGLCVEAVKLSPAGIPLVEILGMQVPAHSLKLSTPTETTFEYEEGDSVMDSKGNTYEVVAADSTSKPLRLKPIHLVYPRRVPPDCSFNSVDSTLWISAYPWDKDSDCISASELTLTPKTPLEVDDKPGPFEVGDELGDDVGNTFKVSSTAWGRGYCLLKWVRFTQAPQGFTWSGVFPGRGVFPGSGGLIAAHLHPEPGQLGVDNLFKLPEFQVGDQVTIVGGRCTSDLTTWPVWPRPVTVGTRGVVAKVLRSDSGFTHYDVNTGDAFFYSYAPHWLAPVEETPARLSPGEPASTDQGSVTVVYHLPTYMVGDLNGRHLVFLPSDGEHPFVMAN